MAFFHNSLTRRTIVQAVYSCHFSSERDIDKLLSGDDLLSQNIGNEDLFISVINECFSRWDQYSDIFSFLEFESDITSLMAISIFKAFISELLLQQTDFKILLKEYLGLLNSFCPMEAASMKIYFNKCVELNLLSKYKSCTTID